MLPELKHVDLPNPTHMSCILKVLTTNVVSSIFSLDTERWSMVCFDYRVHLNRRTCERLIGKVDLFIQTLESQNVIWINREPNRNQICRQDSDITGLRRHILLEKAPLSEFFISEIKFTFVRKRIHW